MENKLNHSTRENVWIALSDAFVDSKMDYDNIAGRIQKLEKQEIKKIFFREVAPICGLNLMTTAPSVWHYFDENFICEEINGMLKKRENSCIYRLRNNIFIAFCYWNFREEWSAVEIALDKQVELH